MRWEGRSAVPIPRRSIGPGGDERRNLAVVVLDGGGGEGDWLGRVTVLLGQQASKGTALRLELLVGAVLDNSSGFEHCDLVDVPQRAEAMRDDDDGASRGEPLDGAHHFGFRLDIEVGSGLVQDEDRRVAQDRPRYRDALPLATGEVLAVLPHLGVVTVGYAHDGVVDARLLRSRHDFIVRVLEHHPDVAA